MRVHRQLLALKLLRLTLRLLRVALGLALRLLGVALGLALRLLGVALGLLSGAILIQQQLHQIVVEL